MINLVIDTNIFRKDPKRANAPFLALRTLACNGSIQLYLPYIIEEEFLSQQVEDRNKSINNITKDLGVLARKDYSDVLIRELEIQNNSFSFLKEKLILDVREKFNLWCTELNVKKVALNFDQTRLALTSYFSGGAPYQSLKNRKDIPDSIIFEALKEINSEVDGLTFISEDQNLLKHIQTIGINTFNKLEDFIGKKEIQEFLIEHRITDEYFEGILTYLEGSTLEEYLKIDPKMFENKTIYDDSFYSDNNEAEIQYVDSPTHIEFDLDDMSYYGNSLIGFNVSFRIEANINLFIFKGDYYTVAEEEYSFVEDWNEHYFLVEKDIVLLVHAKVILKIDIERLNASEEPIDFENIIDIDSLLIDSIDDIELYDSIEHKNPQEPFYNLLVQIDTETAERCGVVGTFQVVSIDDFMGVSYTNLVDSGFHYHSFEQLKKDLSEKLKVSISNIDISEA